VSDDESNDDDVECVEALAARGQLIAGLLPPRAQLTQDIQDKSQFKILVQHQQVGDRHQAKRQVPEQNQVNAQATLAVGVSL